MDRLQKAQKSAEDIAVIAKFMANALALDYPKDKMRTLLNVPLKQLEDEMKELRSFVETLG